jgi:hypothetical protein
MLIAFERIAAHEFSQAIRLMRIRGAHGPHLEQRDVDAALGQLPGGFGTRESAADHMNARLQPRLTRR